MTSRAEGLQQGNQGSILLNCLCINYIIFFDVIDFWHSLFNFLYKSFTQAGAVIPRKLSIDLPGIARMTCKVIITQVIWINVNCITIQFHTFESNLASLLLYHTHIKAKIGEFFPLVPGVIQTNDPWNKCLMT